MAETFEPPIDDFFASMVWLLLDAFDRAPAEAASTAFGLTRPLPSPDLAASTVAPPPLIRLISSVSCLSRSLRPFYDAYSLFWSKPCTSEMIKRSISCSDVVMTENLLRNLLTSRMASCCLFLSLTCSRASAGASLLAGLYIFMVVRYAVINEVYNK